MVGFGARSSLGLFLEPMTIDRGWSRETFGLALALQNLFWGLGLPIAGALTDKLGASRIIMIGAVVYAFGLYLMGIVETESLLYLSAGILSGLGIAFSAFSLALAAMVKVVGPERRTIILGLGTAAGSFGQVVFSPLAQSFIQLLSWSATLGSFLAGYVGQKYSMKISLSTIYSLRALLIFILLMSPKTALVILCFAACTLFGIVFLSHQIGSFIGVWLGGALYDNTGSYDSMWWAGIALGLLAAIIHLPINEKPLARLNVQIG